MSWIKITFLSFSLFFTAHIQAYPILIGDSLPKVQVDRAGEVSLSSNTQDATFTPWSSQQLQNKTYVIHALAARSSARKQK